MQNPKVFFKNKIEIAVFDSNFYHTIFERIISLHKKT